MLIVNFIKQLSNFKLNISFEVENEIIVFFGPSGSGKTTILNIISGVDNPDSGCIKLNNTTFFESPRKILPIQNREVGYLFQDYALFPHMTVKKNILYGAKKETIDSPIIKQLLDVMNLKPLLDKYPSQISGGEKQRVALSRALSTMPKLLLLDEPFSALDQNTRYECHEELLRLHRIWNIPIILVTHDLEEAKKLGDKILFIENGQINNQSPLSVRQ